MKIFRNNMYYVDVLELDKLPKYFKIDEQEIPEEGYVKVTDRKSIEYLLTRKDILDYDALYHMSNKELSEEVESLHSNLSRALDFINSASEEVLDTLENEKYLRLKKRYDKILLYLTNRNVVDNLMSLIVGDIEKFGLRRQKRTN